MRWAVNNTPRPLYSRERDPVTIVQDARRTPAPVCMGAESFAPLPLTGFIPRSVQPVESRYTDRGIPDLQLLYHSTAVITSIHQTNCSSSFLVYRTVTSSPSVIPALSVRLIHRVRINSSTFSPGRDTDPRSTTAPVPRRLSVYSSPSVTLSKVNLSSSAGFCRACTQ
jgi:hypothetical protein